MDREMFIGAVLAAWCRRMLTPECHLVVQLERSRCSGTVGTLYAQSARLATAHQLLCLESCSRVHHKTRAFALRHLRFSIVRFCCWCTLQRVCVQTLYDCVRVRVCTLGTLMRLHLLEDLPVERIVDVVCRVFDSVLVPLRDICWVWVRPSDGRVRATASVRAFVSAAIWLPLQHAHRHEVQSIVSGR